MSGGDQLGKGISGLHQLKQLSFTFPEQHSVSMGFNEQALSICMAAQSDPLRSHHLHASFRAEVSDDYDDPFYHYDETVDEF